MNKYDKKYKLILDFLKIIDANRESKRFLKLFHKGDPARFAVVKLSGTILDNSRELIAIDLAYLSHLDLFPVVVHGGGKQIDTALSNAGLLFKKKDGIRITTKEQMPVIKKVLNRINAQLVRAIERYGGKALGLTKNIITAEPHPDRRLGFVGTVKKINIDLIAEIIKCKTIPIISCLGFSQDGNPYNINADETAKALVLSMKPKKYIIVTEEGGIKDSNGNILPNINLADELPTLEQQGIIKDGMLVKVKEAKETLEKIRYHLPIQITSSKHMLKELFTEKGNGTFIKSGSEIIELSNWNSINKKRVEHLITKSFGRILKPNYFNKPVAHIFLDTHYRGVAIVQQVLGTHYLDKFCVSEAAQGQGIARDIWLKMISCCQSLFWRSRYDNPINCWYFDNAEGGLKCGKWILFWINIRDEQIIEAKNHIMNLEESFC
jgi:bifunctional N-acetylglutamate synthase/kinase